MTDEGDHHEVDDPDGDADETVVRRDRFSGGPARSFLSSLAADERIFAADLAVGRAHVVMLTEQGIVSETVAGEILGALDAVESAGHGALPDGEDVHEAIESAVVARVGADGGKMHTARSRNDEVATCIRHRLRDDLLDATTATLGLRESLVTVAESHHETVMPGYTHRQPAQPTTVAHWALSYESALARDTARLLAAFDRTNQSPLGAAAFAGTPFDVDRDRTADLLGFDGTVRNSADAAAGRDFLAETLSALATAAVTVSGLAEDAILFAGDGLLSPADDYASTSSIMPQKVNPDTLELVRATAGTAVGDLTGLLTTLKGLPRAYNRDLQRATPRVWNSIDDTTEAIEVAAGAVGTADWNEDALEVAARRGFSTATGVADLLAQSGVPFRSAHEAVAAAAAEAESAVAAAEYDDAVAVIDAAVEDVFGDSVFEWVERDELVAALDPVESVAARDSAGGPAPSATVAEATAATAEISADRAAVSNRRERLTTAAETLAAEVDEYV